MARGWERKDVENQQLERPVVAPVKSKSAEEQKRNALQLQRQRILGELQATCHPRFRGQLERELAHLDAELAKLP